MARKKRVYVNPQTLALVVGLALLTEDRDDDEQQALTGVCGKLDRTLGTRYVREATDTWTPGGVPKGATT